MDGVAETSFNRLTIYTKFHWEDCEEIRDELLELRRIEKELLAPPKRKKWERIK